MPIRQSLPAVLRGEADAELLPGARAHLAALAAEAAAEGASAWLRDECAGRLKQPGASRGVHYLLALACARNGEVERGHQTLLALGEALAGEGAWEPLAAVSEEALALEASGAAARLLVRAHEGLGREPDRIEALRRAREVLPEDLELALALARRLAESGDTAESHELAAVFLPSLVAEERWDDLDEWALAFAEAGSAGAALALVAKLVEVVKRGGAGRARGLFEVVWPAVESAGRAGDAHPSLRSLVAALDPAAAEVFRGPLRAAVEAGPARALPDAGTVLATSGLADRGTPLLAALERWEAIARLPPGAAVLHASFGVGRIQANDATAVVTDFEKVKARRMPYEAALRTLTILAEDDLRLLRFERGDELGALRRDAPAEVMVRALRALGGEADAARLKLFLTGHDVVPAREWTSFLRAARAAAEADPRIDHSRAFEQRYRLAPGPGDAGPVAGVLLPSLSPRRSARENLTALRRFLGQHADAEPAVARRFGRLVEGIVRDAQGARADRARAVLHLLRWEPQREEEWKARIGELWEGGLDLGDLPSEDEQLALFDATLGTESAADALLSAADSRFSSVRGKGARATAALGAEGQAHLERTTLDHAAHYPQAALRLLQRVLEEGAPALEPWRAFTAALALIEEKPKPSVAQKVLEWLAAGGRIERALGAAACPENLRPRIAALLRQWRSSDRYLLPALEAAERAGLAAEAAAVREARQRATEKMFAQVGRAAERDVPLMTRATWGRLKAELERMERELRTTLPATIQRARELGDLRENAEYHAARQKQALLNKQVSALQLRLARARFVEDAAFQDGVVGVGTEVVLEGERDVVSYWILGEGEHHLGAQVISHQAPVARALIGKGIGDEIELGEGRQRYRVVSVERKLPTGE